MFYSSGTTGRPKGIKPPQVGGAARRRRPSFSVLVAGLYGGGEDTRLPQPGAALPRRPRRAGRRTVHRLGGTVVVMERFDPLEVLALIERHRVTHVQFVPTHLVRLLKLPAEDRRAVRPVEPARSSCTRPRRARPT